MSSGRRSERSRTKVDYSKFCAEDDDDFETSNNSDDDFADSHGAPPAKKAKITKSKSKSKLEDKKVKPRDPSKKRERLSLEEKLYQRQLEAALEASKRDSQSELVTEESEDLSPEDSRDSIKATVRSKSSVKPRHSRLKGSSSSDDNKENKTSSDPEEKSADGDSASEERLCIGENSESDEHPFSGAKGMAADQVQARELDSEEWERGTRSNAEDSEFELNADSEEEEEEIAESGSDSDSDFHGETRKLEKRKKRRKCGRPPASTSPTKPRPRASVTVTPLKMLKAAGRGRGKSKTSTTGSISVSSSASNSPSTVAMASRSLSFTSSNSGSVIQQSSPRTINPASVMRPSPGFGLGGVNIKTSGPSIRVGLSRNVRVKPLLSQVPVQH